MAELRKLSLFPLNTVLFPGITLPLHIFEPRYRVMINRCLKLNQPFGVVLIREGQEVGGDAIPYAIGTSAYITHVQPLDGGRMNIQAVGHQRFRVERIEQSKPFLVAWVEAYPLATSSPTETNRLARHIRQALENYVEVLLEATETDLPPSSLPDDNMALANLAASTLPLPAEEKQDLLSAPDLASMLNVEWRLIRRELMLLQYMVSHPPAIEDPDMPFSLN